MCLLDTIHGGDDDDNDVMSDVLSNRTSTAFQLLK